MIGERLTELRVKNNMTQEEFAEYMCVTRQSVSKWETDKTYPDVEKLIKISELYNVSLDYLIRGQEEEHIIEQTEATTVSEETIITPQKHNNTGIKICLGISLLFCMISIGFIIMFLIQNPWFHSDIIEQQVKVDAIYGQLSVAQVSYENEMGEDISEFVFIDTANAGQGDFINLYSDGNGNIFIDYGAGILSFVIIFLIVNSCSTVLLIKELRKI